MNQTADNSTNPAPERIAYLIAAYVKKSITPAEHDELDAWVEASDANMKLFEDLTDEDKLEEQLAWMNSLDTEARLQAVKQQLKFTTPARKPRSGKFWLYGIAAVIVIAAAALYLLNTTNQNKSHTAQHIDPAQQDILPATANVTLTLGNGKTVAVSDTATVAPTDGGSSIRNIDGQLNYTYNSNDAAVSNTLSTGAGSTYRLLLADGTLVWLNAGSSLTYPTRFTGNERLVHLTGEAFFEVAKTGAAFKVQTNDKTTVKVLGTQFNVHHYDDETTNQVTLVEGSVEVTYNGNTARLQPAQQVIASSGILTKSTADIEAATGWKNDQFVFHDAGIEQIMQQVKRWYDVQVVFKGKSLHQFNATINRKEPLSRLLRLLELTGKVQFKIENKTIYVL